MTQANLSGAEFASSSSAEKPSFTEARSTSEMLLEAKGIGVNRAGRWIVRDVDLHVGRGEIVTLIGPNGGGKTTILNALLGLTHLDTGRVSIGEDVKLSYVPQKLTIDRSLPMPVRRLMTLTDSFAEAEIVAALEAVGMSDYIDAPIDTLSGGEFQRVLMARAIIRRPDLLILDEPVQGVDFKGEVALYDLISQFRDDLGCGILLVSHDLHIVMAKTDRVVCVNGHICCSGPAASVAEDPSYVALFGPKAAQTLALYRHEHDHEHHHDGSVVSGSHDCCGE